MNWLLNKFDQWQLWAVIIALAILAITACTPTIQTVFVPVELTRPPKPLLPKITADDLACNKPEAVQKIMDRDRILRNYSNLLITIIDSTKQTGENTNAKPK